MCVCVCVLCGRVRITIFKVKAKKTPTAGKTRPKIANGERDANRATKGRDRDGTIKRKMVKRGRVVKRKMKGERTIKREREFSRAIFVEKCVFFYIT